MRGCRIGFGNINEPTLAFFGWRLDLHSIREGSVQFRRPTEFGRSPFPGIRGGARIGISARGVPLGAVTAALGLSLAIESVLLLAAGFLLTLGVSQNTPIVLRVLHEIFRGHAVIAQLRITRQLAIFVDDLLRRAPYLSIRTGTIKDPVDDIGTRETVAVHFGPRAGF